MQAVWSAGSKLYKILNEVVSHNEIYEYGILIIACWGKNFYNFWKYLIVSKILAVKMSPAAARR